MKLVLRTLLKSLSSKLLMDVIMIAVEYTKKKEWIKDEDILKAIGTNLDCKIKVEKK